MTARVGDKVACLNCEGDGWYSGRAKGNPTIRVPRLCFVCKGTGKQEIKK